MLIKEFDAAINQICSEKGISKEAVIETIETALAAAFRKDYGKPDQNIKAKFNPKNHTFDLYDVKEIVEKEEDIKDPRKEITLKDAKKKKKSAKVGDTIKTKIKTPKEYGRIAAQTAKQVIIQKIREAERDALLQAFEKRKGELVNGIIQRIEGNTVYVDLGQTTGFLPPSEQAPGEQYQINSRIKIYIKEVQESPKGPEIILSRIHPDIISTLFTLEVPEINAGTVEIKSVAREAGLRTKIAVKSNDEEVDPIGACVGQKGSRVQAVINEINGEKIDIVEWSKNQAKFVTNALAPAQVLDVKLDKKEKKAEVIVEPDQLSLAIGKEGQNVRLAARLTDWKIDVKAASQERPSEAKKKDKEKKEKTKEKIKKKKSPEKKEKKSEKKKTKKSPHL